MRNKYYFLALLITTYSLTLSSCKKNSDNDDGNGVGNGINLEQLGSLTQLYHVGFSFSGEPVVQLANYQLYEWSSTGKEWRQLGSITTENVLKIAQDAAGNYIRCGSFVYTLDKATGNWEKVNLSENQGNAALARMVANEKGDVVIRLFYNNKFYYYKKETNQSNWVKVKEVNRTDDPWNQDRHPLFLTNAGILYYGTGSGSLYDIVLNTNTAAFGLLFDRYAPDVVSNFGQDGLLLGANYITPDGTVYVITEHINASWKAKLWKLSPQSLPATIDQVQQFDLPAREHATGGWLTRSGGTFVVDASGNIRTYLSCQKYPDSHWFAATGKIGSSKMNTYNDHPASQRGILPNQKGETYVMTGNGNMYKWN